MVVDPLECHVVNFEELENQGLSGNCNHPKIMSQESKFQENYQNKSIHIDKIIYINKFDFLPTDKLSKHYLTLSSSVLLKQSGFIMSVVDIYKAENGNIKKLTVRLDKLQTTGAKGRKVITWVSHPAPAKLNIFDNLLLCPHLKKDDVISSFNTKSWLVTDVLIEQYLKNKIGIGNNFTYGQIYQAERFGYISVDEKSTEKDLHLNMVCFLKIHEDLKNAILSVCEEW